MQKSNRVDDYCTLMMSNYSDEAVCWGTILVKKYSSSKQINKILYLAFQATGLQLYEMLILVSYHE